MQADELGFEKVMLTCFEANEGALRMYEKLGYELDESSPDPLYNPELTGCVVLNQLQNLATSGFVFKVQLNAFRKCF